MVCYSLSEIFVLSPKVGFGVFKLKPELRWMRKTVWNRIPPSIHWDVKSHGER